jgi:hypothetical protein
VLRAGLAAHADGLSRQQVFEELLTAPGTLPLACMAWGRASRSAPHREQDPNGPGEAIIRIVPHSRQPHIAGISGIPDHLPPRLASCSARLTASI